jgi:hypothetical protein
MEVASPEKKVLMTMALTISPLALRLGVPTAMYDVRAGAAPSDSSVVPPTPPSAQALGSGQVVLAADPEVAHLDRLLGRIQRGDGRAFGDGFLRLRLRGAGQRHRQHQRRRPAHHRTANQRTACHVSFLDRS